MRVWISLKLVIGKGSDTTATSLQDAGPELIELPDQNKSKQSRATHTCGKAAARCSAKHCDKAADANPLHDALHKNAA